MRPAPVQDQPAGGRVTLRYWAAARAATGLTEESVEVPGAVTLAALVDGAVARHGGASSRAAAVLASCSVLLGDQPVSSAEPGAVLVEPGMTVEFLPPFAGG
ncbi:MAG: MoaD/ThiS family protein [Marmoricola sp.]